MMKKRFVLSLSALVASALLFIGTSFAWFVVSTQNDIGEFNQSLYGVYYDLNGDLVEEVNIYPELELVNNPVTIANSSTNNLFLRIKIEYTKVELNFLGGGSYSTTNLGLVGYSGAIDADNHLIVIMDPLFDYDSDGYWYYDGEIANDGISVELLNSIYYDGTKSSNEYASEEITVKVTIEVRDALKVPWAPLATMITVG